MHLSRKLFVIRIRLFVHGESLPRKKIGGMFGAAGIVIESNTKTNRNHKRNHDHDLNRNQDLVRSADKNNSRRFAYAPRTHSTSHTVIENTIEPTLEDKNENTARSIGFVAICLASAGAIADS